MTTIFHEVGRTLKRVYLRDFGHTTDPTGNEVDQRNIVGWFANKHNIAHGWTISTLDSFDTLWMERFGFGNNIGGRNDVNGIYRIASNKGRSLAWFNFDTGTVRFFDNEKYESTDKPAFERGYAYDRVFFDVNPFELFDMV